MGRSWERLAELEAERQQVIGELAREVADMSPEAREGWTHELEAAGVAPAEAEQYVQGLHQLGLDARAREAELEPQHEVEAEAEGEGVGREEVELEEAQHVSRDQEPELEHEGPELSR
jgi:hypothetical protein